MAINFKDIKKNFILEYIQYWIIFAVFLLLIIIKSIYNYLYSTDNLTVNVVDAMYVSSGVAINEYFVIANKEIITNACIGGLSGLQGQLFIVDYYTIYPAVVYMSDSVSNMVLLKLKHPSEFLTRYAYLQIDSPEYKVGRRLLMPITTNKPGIFKYQQVKIVADYGNDFFVSTKKITSRDSMTGIPIFNKNFVLQGIVRSKKMDYKNISAKDITLNKMRLQKTFMVNGITTIKAFLERFRIKYYEVSGNTNLNNINYEPKKSIVNIICIPTY